MLQARQAVARQSWSHPQEPAGEEWWADVLADPRARHKQLHYRAALIEHYRLGDGVRLSSRRAPNANGRRLSVATN
jgi:hypothetical protein